MILRWIKSLGQNNNSPDVQNINSSTPAKGIDVAERTLELQAAYKKKELESLISKGWPYVKKEKFRSKVRQKVWSNIKDSSIMADAEMIDEITEKIMDVAENDQFYKKIFDD